MSAIKSTKGKLEIFNETDRLAVASILVKNGYTVSQSKERVDGKRSYLYFLEYSKNKAKAEAEEES